MGDVENATIIAASLQDDELKKAVQTLVETVESHTNKMAESFTSAVNTMAESMNGLIESQKSYTQHVERESKARISSYDKEAEAAKNALRIFPSNVSPTTLYTINPQKDIAPQVQAMVEREQELLKQKEAEAAVTREIAEEEKRVATLVEQSAERERQRVQTEEHYLQQKRNSKRESDAELKTTEQLEERLRNLKRRYAELGSSKKYGDTGKELLSNIHEVEWAIRRIKTQEGRRMNINEVLGIDVKTLDDVAYKIQQLQAYKRGINFTDPKEASEIKMVNSELDKMTKIQDKYMSRGQRMTGINQALTRSWNYMKNRLAYMITFIAAKNFVKQILDIRSQYELLERSIGILTDSAQKGSKIFRELNEMALKSPFTTMELGAAAKQLVAFNIGAEDVVDTTRRLADMAAAVGIPMDRLTYALGQVKAYGYLNSRDARIFLNAGIPIVAMLQDYYNAQRDVNEEMLTATQVRDMMTKRLISFSDVMAVVNKATDEGGRFFNFQEKAADTLKIRLANLTLAYNNMLNEWGKSSQGSITFLLKTITAIIKNWRVFERIIASSIATLGTYKSLVILFGRENEKWLGARMLKHWRDYIARVKEAKTVQQAFNAAVGKNGIYLLVTALMAAVSYFVLFNNKTKEAKRHVQELSSAFSEMEGNFTKMFVKGLRAESFNDRLSELRDMIAKAKEDLNIVIPIKLEDVNESNIRQKLRETQTTIEEYISTGRVFATTAAETKNFEKNLKDAETQASKLSDIIVGGVDEINRQLDKAGVSANNLLPNKEKSESDIEYINKIISQLEYLNLLERRRKGANEGGGVENLIGAKGGELDESTIKVLAGFVAGINEFEKKTKKADKSAEEFFQNLSYKLDITRAEGDKMRFGFEQLGEQLNLTESSLQYLKDFGEDEYQIRFYFSLDDEEKNNTERELQGWQQKVQDWADKNGIRIPTSLDFTNESIATLSMSDYIEKVGSEWKQANEDWGNKTRAAVNGVVGSDAVSSAKTLADTLKSIYTIAGGDPTSLNKNKGAKKDPLGDAMSKEIQYITDLQKLFKDYRSYGMDTQTALTEATNEFTKSLEKQHKELEKYGVKGVSGETLATMDMRGIRDMYQGWLDEAKVQKSAKAVESLEKAIKNLNNEINKEDYKKKTDSLNNTLSKLSQEYELGVELYANTDLSDAYADLLDIDPSTISNSIDDYADKVKDAINAAFKDRNVGYTLETMNLTDDDLRWMKNEMTGVGKVLSDGDYELIKQWVENLRKLRKDYAKDLVTQTEELRYELADTEGKIAIEMKRLDDLKDKRKKTTDGSDEANLLDLKIQKQEQTIAKLGDEAVELFATYSNLFNSIVEHSDFVTRRLAKQWNDALLNAVRNADGSYSIIDPNSGQTTRVSEQKYGRLLNQSATQMRKVQNSFEKIREALTKGDDKIVDWVEGLKLITQEVATIGDGLRTASEIMEALGASEGAVEVMNDVASTMEGIGQMGQGVAELATNPISGAIHIIQGAWKAISTWLDNKNNEITRRIEEQERRVKDLQIAYEGLEYAAEKAMGAAEIEARRLAISNKKAQLAIEESNLALEKQREYKKQTDQKEQQDRIKEYESNIASLKREIEDMSESIVNDLLGEDMKSAAQSFVDAWVDAWKAGETTLDAMKEKMDEMVESLINRAVTSALIEKPLNDLYEQIDTFTKREGRGGTGEYAITEEEMREIAAKAGTTAEEINRILGEYYGMLKQMGIMTDGVADKNLSALQQGIQGITEDTAGAIEAYLNGISGQIYLHSTLLTEIRDAVVSIEGGAGMAIQAQMLFQLQQSYMVQMSIQNVLNGWSSPDGLSVRVDMI